MATLLVGTGVLLAVSAPRAAAQCQRAKLTASDGAPQDLFSFSLALSGNVAVIGAPFNDEHGSNSGAVYVFERQGALWPEPLKLTLDDAATGDGFGRSVGASADTALAGSVGRDTVYVFERSGPGTWDQVAELTPDDGTDYDFFAWSAAVSGDFAVVGAPNDDAAAYESGSAYVFERDPYGAWSQAAKLVAADGAVGDHFGDAVAVNGDLVVIGAQDDDDLGSWSGSAYIFERSPDGTWWQVAKLLPDDGWGMWNFGISVSVSGELALIGADRAHGATYYTGAAYVFQRDADGTWPEVAKLIADDGQNSDSFGFSVALSADVAVIGARWDHVDTSGSAYVFVREVDGTWSQVAKLVPDDGAYHDEFGYSAALSGNVALIGAWQDDDQGGDSGSAYVFAVGPDDDGDGVMDVCEGLGDLNCDDLVNGFDIDPFVLALTSAPEFDEYYAAYPDCDHTRADCNEDGSIDGFDIDPFVALLTGG